MTPAGATSTRRSCVDSSTSREWLTSGVTRSNDSTSQSETLSWLTESLSIYYLCKTCPSCVSSSSYSSPPSSPAIFLPRFLSPFIPPSPPPPPPPSSTNSSSSPFHTSSSKYGSEHYKSNEWCGRHFRVIFLLLVCTMYLIRSLYQKLSDVPLIPLATSVPGITAVSLSRVCDSQRNGQSDPRHVLWLR